MNTYCKLGKCRGTPMACAHTGRCLHPVIVKAKPQFIFYFADEPQFAAQDAREHTAHLLRSYRFNRERFHLIRFAPHRYGVRNRYPGSPVAILEAQGVQS